MAESTGNGTAPSAGASSGAPTAGAPSAGATGGTGSSSASSPGGTAASPASTAAPGASSTGATGAGAPSVVPAPITTGPCERRADLEPRRRDGKGGDADERGLDLRPVGAGDLAVGSGGAASVLERNERRTLRGADRSEALGGVGRALLAAQREGDRRRGHPRARRGRGRAEERSERLRQERRRHEARQEGGLSPWAL